MPARRAVKAGPILVAVRARAILLSVAVLLLGLVGSSPAQAHRFEGYASGYIGADHSFVVGDGFDLVFIDHRQSYTPYRVCWHRLHHAHHRCWHGETGPRGKKDRIFTAAPDHVGKYLVKWTVNGHRKARWWFHNGVGD
jgi:hypothetical protein